MLCGLVDRNQHYTGTYFLNLQGSLNMHSANPSVTVLCHPENTGQLPLGVTKHQRQAPSLAVHTYYGYGWTMALGITLGDVCLLLAWLNISLKPQASHYSLTSSESQTCSADSAACCCSYSGPVDNKLQLYSRIQEAECDWTEISLGSGNHCQQTKSPETKMLKVYLWLSLTWGAHHR
jgi:hypothetical protein